MDNKKDQNKKNIYSLISLLMAIGNFLFTFVVFFLPVISMRIRFGGGTRHGLGVLLIWLFQLFPVIILVGSVVLFAISLLEEDSKLRRIIILTLIILTAICLLLTNLFLFI